MVLKCVLYQFQWDTVLQICAICNFYSFYVHKLIPLLIYQRMLLYPTSSIWGIWINSKYHGIQDQESKNIFLVFLCRKKSNTSIL